MKKIMAYKEETKQKVQFKVKTQISKDFKNIQSVFKRLWI